MREKKLTIVAVVLVCLGLLAYLVVFSVRIDQVAAQYRAGSVVRIIRPVLGAKSDAEAASLQSAYPKARVVTHAGWFWKLPWPFDKVEKFDQRVRNVDGPASQTQLADGNHVIPRVYATWRIYDPVAFQKSLSGDLQQAQDRLKNIIGTQTNNVFGVHRLQDVVNTDPKKLQFDQIENTIFANVKNEEELGSSANAYGIEVLSLGIERIALPPDTTKAVFDRMIAERNSVAAKLESEGQAQKATEVAEANAQADTIKADADAQAKDIRAEGEAEAAQYYKVFAQNEQLAIFLRRLEALKKITSDAIASGNPIALVLSSKTEPFGILNQPPQAANVGAPPAVPLVQGSSANGAPAVPAGQAAAPSAEAPPVAVPAHTTPAAEVN
jgi:membrane protease subunit HflC